MCFHVFLRLLIQYGFIILFFCKKQNSLHCSLKIHVCSRGGGGGMGGCTWYIPMLEREPSSSFSHMCVCVYKYIICMCIVSSLCVGACGAFRCSPLLLSLSLFLSSYNCRRCWLRWRGGGRQTHFVVILIAASLKRTPQSTPWTWWDRPP